LAGKYQLEVNRPSLKSINKLGRPVDVVLEWR
jgi:hypothetical protein